MGVVRGAVELVALGVVLEVVDAARAVGGFHVGEAHEAPLGHGELADEGFSVGVAGRRSAAKESSRDSKSEADSPGWTRVWALSPCLRAFRRDAALPSPWSCFSRGSVPISG
jgi:hypothetical protein